MFLKRHLKQLSTLRPRLDCPLYQRQPLFCHRFSTMAAAEAEEKKIEMNYRTMGGTGLKVSALSFGFWATFGSKGDLMEFEGAVAKAAEILKVARKGGVNFFDNAEAYGKPRGYAEEIMGAAIKKLAEEDAELWRRSDIVISTKIFWGGDGRNEKGLSRKHLAEGADACLKRLQMDYVDVLFCHRPDPLTPTEEIVQGMTDLIRQGKCFYWGTSEWSAQQITEAYWIAQTRGLIAPVVEQPQYNMVYRERFEKEYQRLYQAPYNIGTTIWSPLKSGILTGKYNDGIPEGTRLANEEWLQSSLTEDTLTKVRAMTKFAKDKYDTTPATLAIAWCLKNKNVSTVLLGATKTSQIEENLKALDVARKITKADYDEINDTILKNGPEMPGYWGRQEPDEADIEAF